MVVLKSKFFSFAFGVCLLVAFSFASKALYLSQFTDSEITQKPFVFNDSHNYYEPAVSLAQGQQFESATRTPGYPAFLALIYRLTSNYDPLSPINLRLVFLVQIFLLSCGCIPIALSVRQLTEKQWLALLAAALWAIHNAAFYYSARILTDGVAAALMCWLIYFIVAAEKSGQLRWYALEGLCCILLILLRPSFSLMPIPLAFGQLITWKIKGSSYKNYKTLIAILAFVLVIPSLTPTVWAYRNYLVTGDSYYCRLSTFGFWAYSIESAVDVANGHSPRLDEYHTEFSALLPVTKSKEMDAIYKQRILHRLFNSPLIITRYFIASSIRLCFPQSPTLGYKPALQIQFWKNNSWGMLLAYCISLVSSLIELILTATCLVFIMLSMVKRFRPEASMNFGFLVVSLMLIGYWWLIHANANASSRFLLPLQPLLLVACANAYLTVSRMWINKFRDNRSMMTKATP